MTGPLHVVAAVIIADGRVLACRRAQHTSEAGRWEFPGGKIEPGESPEAALVREIAEELGVDIAVTGHLTTDDTVVRGRVLRLVCLTAELAGPSPTESTDHDELRWVEPAALPGLDWAEPDLPAVALLAAGDHKTETLGRFMVAALLDPIAAGTTFDRTAWPAHVTVLSNFRTSASAADVASRVVAADLATHPLGFQLGRHALFGANANIPVLLVQSEEFRRLHERAAGAIADLPGLAEDEPAHWGAGYRAHLTLAPGVSAATGDHREAASLAVVQLSSTSAAIHTTIAFPPA